MTPHSLQALTTSLHTMPMAMLFTKQLLLTESTWITPEVRIPEPAENPLQVRATYVSRVLRDIQGYDHSGLNE